MQAAAQGQQQHRNDQQRAHLGKARQPAQFQQHGQYQDDLRQCRGLAKQARAHLQGTDQHTVHQRPSYDQCIPQQHQQGQPPGQYLA